MALRTTKPKNQNWLLRSRDTDVENKIHQGGKAVGMSWD